MNSALSLITTTTTATKASKSQLFQFTKPKQQCLSPVVRLSGRDLNNYGSSLRVTACSSKTNPFVQTLKNATVSAVFLTATALSFCRTARAEAQTPPTTLTQQQEEKKEDEIKGQNSGIVHRMFCDLEQQLESIVGDIEWRLIQARVMVEMGEAQIARKLYDEVLDRDPLKVEALCENAWLMRKCGESEEAVIGGLKEAMGKVEGRERKLLMGLVKFLQKNVEEAVKSYRELSDEDPNDYRPYYYLWMIYNELGRDEEAREQYVKYEELYEKKYNEEVLSSISSRNKVSGDNEGK